MSFNNLTRTTAVLKDGGLVVKEPALSGRTLLVMGTASKGAIYKPVPINNTSDLVNYFGDISTGTLVRAGYEALEAGGQEPYTLYCMRIGEGSYASGYMYEASGSGVTAPTTGSVAITIDALQPGALSNQFTFSGISKSDGVYLLIHNPFTNTDVAYKLDTDYTAADIVDIINNDATLNPYIKATLTVYDLDPFQIEVSGDFSTMPGVSENSTGDSYLVNLFQFFSGEYATSGDYIHDSKVVVVGSDFNASGIYNIPLTAFNNIHELQQADTVATLAETLDISGKLSASLSSPVRLKSDGYPYPLLDVDTGLVNNDGTAKFIGKNVIVATADGVTTDYTIDLKGVLANGTLKVYITKVSGATEESTDYTPTQTGTVLTLAWTDTTKPEANSIITIDFETEAFDLTRQVNINDVLQSTDYTNYFISGSKITFGAPLPYDLKVSYYKVNTLSDSDLYFAGATAMKDGVMTISKSVVDPAYNVFIFQWSYEPEMITLSSSISLSGGSDNLILTPAEKLTELQNALNEIENQAFDIIVPIDYFLDEVTTTYSETTGRVATKIVDYISVVDDIIKDRLDYVGPTRFVFSITPPDSFTRESISDWVDNMVYKDTDTFHTSLQSYLHNNRSLYIDVPVGAPLITTSAGGTYIGTPAVIYGALLAGLPINQVITHETGANIGQDLLNLNLTQIDTLAGIGLIPLGVHNGVTVFMNGDTFADRNSDYVRVSTYFIIEEIVNSISDKMQTYYKNLGTAKNENTLIQIDVDRILTHFAKELNLIYPNYNFRIYQSLEEEKRGIKHIDITLQPAFELKNIIITMQLQLTQ